MSPYALSVPAVVPADHGKLAWKSQYRGRSVPVSFRNYILFLFSLLLPLVWFVCLDDMLCGGASKF